MIMLPSFAFVASSCSRRLVVLSTFFISVYLKRYYIMFCSRGYNIICVFFTHIIRIMVTYSTKICEPCAAVVVIVIFIAESDKVV